MNEHDERFSEFERVRDKGIKEDTKRAVSKFIDGFENFQQKSEWTKSYLDGVIAEKDYVPLIRYEIYAEVIFPVLAEGAARDDVWSWLWIYRTEQNFWQGETSFAKDFDEPEEGLLLRLYRLAPDDPTVRTVYLNHIIRFLDHCVHEWPAGILYGMNGATPEQCEELHGAVKTARNLDGDKEFEAFLADFETKLIAYQDRLK
ncbi:MAG: hypothetical protein AAFY99_05390 [Pseudomonadota bacterium]